MPKLVAALGRTLMHCWHKGGMSFLWNLLHIAGLTNVYFAKVWLLISLAGVREAVTTWHQHSGVGSVNMEDLLRRTLTSCSSDTGLSPDEVPSCLTYSLTWRRRTVTCLRRLWRDSDVRRGQRSSLDVLASTRPAGDHLHLSCSQFCVCVRTSRDAIKPRATELFAHVRITMKSWTFLCNSLMFWLDSHKRKSYDAGCLLHRIWWGRVVSVYVCVCSCVYVHVH